ncbi:hypothetical protein [Thermoplasma volcanium GSS1]|uniref:Sulphur transport domain-containing protein n=1 Tax=Thermoplasma volcanium (strain ATCC 51530 / DSM 4299 / JCM 9571 / NBRC 15438 / GSS1) TaxID=273116 RepID=Q97A16_THEVO|nr:hypothetical protein [Thermoplasma volcanium GSS1]
MWWGVTGAESQMGGVFWSLFGLKIHNLAYYRVYPIPPFSEAFTWFLVFGIILGPLIVSSSKKEFSVRQVPNRYLALEAVAGGILIGYGTRMAGGCNIGDFYSGFATGSAWAIFFFLAMVSGIGTIIALSRVLPHRIRKLAKVKSIFILPSERIQYSILGLTVGASILIIVFFSYTMVRLWYVFGLILGAIGYSGAMCFQTSFRETISKNTGKTMARILAISLLVYSILSQMAIIDFHVKVNFFFDQSESILYQIIGGYIFGLGMGLAYNCTYSMEWRMGSGNVQAILTFIGLTFIGAPLYALTYSWWHSFVPVVFEPTRYWEFSLYKYGVTGAFIIDLFPVAWLIYSYFSDKTLTTLSKNNPMDN